MNASPTNTEKPKPYKNAKKCRCCKGTGVKIRFDFLNRRCATSCTPCMGMGWRFVAKKQVVETAQRKLEKMHWCHAWQDGNL